MSHYRSARYDAAAVQLKIAVAAQPDNLGLVTGWRRAIFGRANIRKPLRN